MLVSAADKGSADVAGITVCAWLSLLSSPAIKANKPREAIRKPWVLLGVFAQKDLLIGFIFMDYMQGNSPECNSKEIKSGSSEFVKER